MGVSVGVSVGVIDGAGDAIDGRGVLLVNLVLQNDEVSLIFFQKQTFASLHASLSLFIQYLFILLNQFSNVVGFLDGLNVGELVGSKKVGSEVGASVMDEVGVSVSNEVGASVMDEVGALVSDELGASVSDEVGASVMDIVGALVSNEDGASVPSKVGVMVGLGVGLFVESESFPYRD